MTSVAPTSGQERVIRPRRPLHLGHTLRLLQHGGADPTFKARSGTFWLGQATPDGPSTLALWRRGDEVVGQAWGPGAAWSLAALPDLLGEGDDDSGFEERHDLVAQGRKARPGWRITRTRLVLQTLVPAIIEQRVTGQEAFAGHARLVWRFGEPAPGRGSEVGLRVPPAPRDWARIPSWEWTRAGIDGQRAAAAVRASQVGGRLEEAADLPLADAHRRLRAIPGVGEWTAAEVAQRALGDPDSPSFGDYHFAKNLTWALTGTPGDDDLARELLEPWAGHRYRAAAYIGFAAGMRPRRGPRFTLPTHVPGVGPRRPRP